jgi:hypothetical protein
VPEESHRKKPGLGKKPHHPSKKAEDKNVSHADSHVID